MTVLTSAIAHTFLPSILANLPHEWRGTTFANSALLGREVFSASVEKLLLEKHAKRDNIVTEAELSALGNAEDYLRVSTNISVLLELVLGLEVSLPTRQVFTFGSTTIPIISVLLTSKLPVLLYVDEGVASPFTADQLATLALLGTNVTIVSGHPVADPSAVVLALQVSPKKISAAVDAIVSDSVLYIHNPSKVNPDDILVIRKRLSTPLTTPVCEKFLQTIAGVKVTADGDASTPEALADFYAHLQTMSGTSVDAHANPVVFTAGLPAVCSIWLSLLHGGGADILMASTAYGGSSQLTDIYVNKSSGKIHKWKFDITGKNKISDSIKQALDKLTVTATAPTTVLFVEIPTNPDMKVPDIATLAQHLTSYRNTTGKEVLLLVDTTFAPASKVLQKISAVAPDLTTMVFISMSKSVSRGHTTAGTIIANTASPQSRKLLETVRWAGQLLDTTAKTDQLWRLTENHVGVEDRCQKAYEVAVTTGTALQAAVAKYAHGFHMDLAFVSPENAAQGFTTSTYSFNLPPLPNETAEANYAIAQRFVDLLTAHPSFKPCVSFGQDNGKVYCTVPSTSTQGAIKAEDKAKQLVGGVELTRLSFPPHGDVQAIVAVLENAIRVVVRVRPPLPSEKGHATGALAADAAAKTVRVASDSSKSFAFDQVFAASASQDEIFQGTGIASMLLSVLDGYAGSTHPCPTPGIVPRVILGLFDAIAAATLDKKREYSVKCSFVQIYNEQQKIMATHNLNAASSRSHCIYTLYVESVDPTNPDDVTKAKLSLGVTLQESIGINKSLFVLRQVIQTLSGDDGSATNKGVHVPYRDSKLTALLKHSLGGNSITLMIACLSPSDAYVDENLSTLVYAAKAQSISNKPVKNEDPKAQLIQKLRDEVATLKAQLAQAQQVILHLGQLGDQNDNVEATGAISSSADVTPSADKVPPVMKPVMAHTRPASSLASPSPTNNPATPSVQASPPAAATSVVVSSAGTKRLKQNVIDNVELIKNMYQNERQLRSEVDFVTSEVSTVRMENRTLNLENQSLREPQGNNSALEQGLSVHPTLFLHGLNLVADSLQSLSELNRLLKVKAALKHSTSSR
ncbi:hypothetical protein DYB37_000563 [Aphanomyces astaci]|uniref:Kinesin motor domain-containing protein n=1 Tax=Aphanomyces astaci TaxID=112090 RepID=A0A3R7BSH9_APHAT|nr:hypothetical protein DYB37_000563 [Aphanomyces astaci]